VNAAMLRTQRNQSAQIQSRPEVLTSMDHSPLRRKPNTTTSEAQFKSHWVHLPNNKCAKKLIKTVALEPHQVVAALPSASTTTTHLAQETQLETFVE